MSIFGSIMNKIFHHGATSSSSGGTSSGGGAPASGTQTASASSGGASPAGGSAASGSSAASTQAGGGGAQGVDVEAVLSGLAAKNPQKLDWKRSIVDLMKLLDLDSSLTARTELAKELNYTGDTSDSAKMNIWLHKQVMQKLAENGGKVPESLRS
jgi:hypothetical protein